MNNTNDEVVALAAIPISASVVVSFDIELVEVDAAALVGPCVVDDAALVVVVGPGDGVGPCVVVVVGPVVGVGPCVVVVVGPCVVVGPGDGVGPCVVVVVGAAVEVVVVTVFVSDFAWRFTAP